MSVSRRDFLGLVGTTIAGVAVVAAGQKWVKAQSSQTIQAGQADAWTVQAVGAVRHGAVPVTLVHQVTGEQLVVEACRRGSSRPAVASSSRFDLFLANRGDGRTETPRHHELAARALAKHLDQLGAEAPSAVLTMDARLRTHRELFDTNDDFVRG